MKHLQILWLLVVVLSCTTWGSESRLAAGVKADKILIIKSAHTMTLLNGASVLKTYKVAIGRGPVGPKTQRGDHKTPEGNYVIDAKKSVSRFHRALHVSYPSPADRRRAQQDGVDPGGDIEIHGSQNGLGWTGSLHQTIDWTNGCIAVTDNEIDEIWRVVSVGTPVEIRP